METVPYRELVARNIRAARGAAALTQSDLSQRMRALGFTGWYPQAISLIEKNIRRPRLDEALGLTVALETQLDAIAYPPADWQHVSLPSGFEVVLPAARYFYQPSRVWLRNRLR